MHKASMHAQLSTKRSAATRLHTSRPYFKQSQPRQSHQRLPVRNIPQRVSGSYLRQTRWIKANGVRDRFSVMCVRYVTALVWYALFFLAHSLFLSFCLSLWRRGCVTTPRGYFGTWPLPRVARTFVWPTGTGSCCGWGDYMRGNWRYWGHTSYTGASTLALMSTRLLH